MKKLFVLLAVVALAVPAFAQDSGEIVINSNVQDYIAITIDDAVLNHDVVAVDDPTINDLAGQESVRAEFTVQANGDYELTIDGAADLSNGVFQNAGASYNQVAFVNPDNGLTHGGALFLDPDPGVQSPGNGNLERWNGSAGALSALGTAGTHTWGLGADFQPDARPDGESGLLPAGTYTTTVTINAAIQ